MSVSVPEPEPEPENGHVDDPEQILDAVIIGAGAAGLAAARDLRCAAKDFVVLEARGRVGGRVFTYRDPAVTAPIELGAEFLHGSTPETNEILRDARLQAVEVVGDHWEAEDGDFSRVDGFWTDIDRVLGKLDEHQTPDRSFADFLAEHAAAGKNKRKHRRARELATEFVQGFHAADPALVSERWLAHGGDLAEDREESRMGRVVEGYDRITAFLAREVFDAIVLNTVVERIEWSEGVVTVFSRGTDGSDREPVHARTVVVTVPVGVLRADASEPGAIVFEPEVSVLREAVSKLAMGSVLRTVFAFKERFWEHGLRNAPGDGALASLSFLHSPGSTVPIWWTLFPVRAPVMVGWVGGPPAAELCALPDDEIARRSLRDLARHLGTTYERLDGLLVGSWTHNWERDPYARGAYSYAMVGGSAAARRLSRPVDGTLFFAGEATDTGGRSGTAEGAIATGRRAARAVLQSLG